MRRLVFGFVSFLMLCSVSLAGHAPALAQQPTPSVQSTSAPGTGATVPITDPRVDPMGTLDDAFFVSMENDSIVPAVDGSTELQPGEFKLLPTEVAVEEFYAELYFVTPTIPEGGEFSVGFCFWVDVAGNCYDIYLQTDADGNTFAGMGYSPAAGDYVMMMQTSLLADEAIDPAPGAQNWIDIVVYDGYVILEGNTFEPLAVMALPDAAVAGQVKAQIGFVDYGLPVGTAPLAVELTDFAVWDLSAGVTPAWDDSPGVTATPESGMTSSNRPPVVIGTTAPAPSATPARS